MSGLNATIEALSTRWMQAWINLDYVILESLMASDFALVISAMPSKRMERSAWLATCQRYRCTLFHYHDVQVRSLSDDVAAMSAIAEQQAELDGVDRSGRFWLTDIWRRDADGQWQVCARYSSFPEVEGQSSAALDNLNRGASQGRTT
jgi:ketosteroid isomerase-like protein